MTLFEDFGMHNGISSYIKFISMYSKYWISIKVANLQCINIHCLVRFFINRIFRFVDIFYFSVSFPFLYTNVDILHILPPPPSLFSRWISLSKLNLKPSYQIFLPVIYFLYVICKTVNCRLLMWWYQLNDAYIWKIHVHIASHKEKYK